MREILAIGVILFGLMCICEPAVSRTVVMTNNDGGLQNNAYSNDLNTIEKYLFGKTYKKESTSSRISRIEKKLFSKNYNTMNQSDRMNNILSNYKKYYDYNKNYLSGYYDNSTPANRIKNRFIGQPTGYTPQIINTTYGYNPYYPGYSRNFTTNRGYRYNNSLPVTTGAGIRILD